MKRLVQSSASKACKGQKIICLPQVATGSVFHHTYRYFLHEERQRSSSSSSYATLFLNSHRRHYSTSKNNAPSNHDITRLQLQIRELKDQVEILNSQVTQLRNHDRFEALMEYHRAVPRATLHLSEVIKRCQDPRYNPVVFCHRELPIHLAHIIYAIEKLPFGLNCMPSVLEVRKKYSESFEKLCTIGIPKTAEEEKSFVKLVEECDERHDGIMFDMAYGIMELKDMLQRHRIAVNKKRNDNIFEDRLIGMQEALDAFNTLMVQYNFVSKQLIHMCGGGEKEGGGGGKLGLFHTDVNLEKVVRCAVEDARNICVEHYGDAPEVVITSCEETSEASFPHLADTIIYIVTELVKNALRATVDHHFVKHPSGLVNCDNMPPVRIQISMKDSCEYGSVAISDEGGGISRQNMSKVMSYTFTTAPKAILQQGRKGSAEGGNTEDEEEEEEEVGSPSPLAGFGYGLPMSRIHARTFLGDLQLSSIEGFGTTAYLFVRRTV